LNLGAAEILAKEPPRYKFESREGTIVYFTPWSRATNRNESQYMSSVPDQTSL